MKSNIFVPKIINVGYQNRTDTFTGKLAYVIYTDEKGVLRKQASWDNWRDSTINPDVFDNIPISGFVLNKKVGDTQSHWNFRQAYCRIYDPRGFEFEITIENLLYILENTNSIVGKGLEGEFVYGWDGKDLVLLPVNSPDYKEIQEFTKLMFSEKTISPKDLVVGYTYKGKDNKLYVYLGKYDEYSSVYPYNQPTVNKGKHLWFAQFKNEEELNQISANVDYLNKYIGTRKSIANKFLLDVLDETPFSYLSEFIDAMKHMPTFSPIDVDNIKVNFFTKEDFLSCIQNYIQKCISTQRYYDKVEFCTKPHNGCAKNYAFRIDTKYDSVTHTQKIVCYSLYQYSDTSLPYSCMYTNDNKPINTWETLCEEDILTIFNIYRPCYINLFLKNGEFYETQYQYLGTYKQEARPFGR